MGVVVVGPSGSGKSSLWKYVLDDGCVPVMQACTDHDCLHCLFREMNESYPHLSFTFSDVCCVIAQCRILKAALHKVGSNIVTYVMNPKAMPRHHLLGHIDMDTREWFDGVLTYSSRQVGAAFALVLSASATKSYFWSC